MKTDSAPERAIPKPESLEAKFKLLQLLPYDKRAKRKHSLVFGFILDWYHSKYGDALASVRHVVDTIKERDPAGRGISLFSAYQSVLSYPIAQLAALKTGMGSEILAEPKDILDLVKTVLPHQSLSIDKHGTKILSYLIDELEEKLLSELIAGLDGTLSDSKNVQQAAAILKAADEIAAASAPKITPPTIT